MSSENKQIVEKVNASFAEGNSEGFLDHCADDVQWTMVGDTSVTGKPAIREWMKSMEQTEPPKFTVDQLIAEGDYVSAFGDMTMKDDTGKDTSYKYCDLYRFQGGKIVELTSFVVNAKPQQQESKASA